MALLNHILGSLIICFATRQKDLSDTPKERKALKEVTNFQRSKTHFTFFRCLGVVVSSNFCALATRAYQFAEAGGEFHMSCTGHNQFHFFPSIALLHFKKKIGNAVT